MLQRVAPSLFRASTGETVTIAAVAQDNNGVESAGFRYGTTNLPPRLVQGHPGCEFDVASAVTTLGTVVAFAPGAPNARYDLFEEDDHGNLVDLQVPAHAAFGSIVQFQIDGLPAPVLAAAPGKKAAKKKAAKKKAAKKKAGKKKTAKKAAKRKALKGTSAKSQASRRRAAAGAAKSKSARKKGRAMAGQGAKKAARKGATKPARRRTATRRGTRRR